MKRIALSLLIGLAVVFIIIAVGGLFVFTIDKYPHIVAAVWVVFVCIVIGNCILNMTGK